METLHPAALSQRGDRGGEQQQRAMRVPLGQLDRAGSAANVLSSPGADALRANKVRLRERKEERKREGKREKERANCQGWTSKPPPPPKATSHSV